MSSCTRCHDRVAGDGSNVILVSRPEFCGGSLRLLMKYDEITSFCMSFHCWQHLSSYIWSSQIFPTVLDFSHQNTFEPVLLPSFTPWNRGPGSLSIAWKSLGPAPNAVIARRLQWLWWTSRRSVRARRAPSALDRMCQWATPPTPTNTPKKIQQLLNQQPTAAEFGPLFLVVPNQVFGFESTLSSPWLRCGVRSSAWGQRPNDGTPAAGMKWGVFLEACGDVSFHPRLLW